MVLLPLLLTLAIACGWGVCAANGADFNDYGFLYNNAKNDGGFNQSAFVGLAHWTRETGVTPRERVTHDPLESEAALRAFAERGVGNIMAIGFTNQAPLAKIAKQYPELHFTLIDGSVDLPNVRSVLFREDEAAFLAGVAAGLSSKAMRIGFIGGMPIPPIRRFECGFLQGVRLAAPDATVMRRYLGNAPSAFRDPRGGEAAALNMIKDGADVLFAAAGLSGNGVLGAAAAAGKLAIGVDVNQNGSHPGRVLTSALKRVDQAVYRSWKAAHEGRWTPGVEVLGVAAEGVGLARDANNESLFAPIAARINAATAEIISGEQKIRDFSENPDCQ